MKNSGLKKAQTVYVLFALSVLVLSGCSISTKSVNSVASRPNAVAQASSGSVGSLGQYSLLNESATQGNSMTLPYGVSREGASLTTYWHGGPDIFKVVPIASSLYEIVETVGNRCITVSGLSVDITTCSGSQSQLLAFNAQSDGSYTLQSSTGSCVRAANQFTMVDAQPCSSSVDQRWMFSGATPLNLGGGSLTPPPAPPPPAPASPPAGTSLGIFSLLDEVANQGNSMTLSYGVSKEGGYLTTYWFQGPDILKVLSMGNGLYEIVETLGNRCVTVNGSSVQTKTCTGTPNQSLTLNSQSDGSYTLQSSSGSCVRSANAFTTIDAQPCSAALNQRWNFRGATALNLGSAAPPPTISNSLTVPPGYHLTFDDEFQTLNISDGNATGAKWYTHTVQCCLFDTSAPSTPTYMAGISDPAGQDPYSLVPGGGLDIRLQKTNGAWYSGVIATVDGTGRGFSQQYGYFEMKAKFPPGQGTWPAFWLLNSATLARNAPAGEIDVVESYMFAPNYINTTLHDWSPPPAEVGYNLAKVADLTKGYHTFGMLWTAQTMTFYCDGQIIYQTSTPAIMNQPYYPLIDLGLGGGWPTNQTPQQSDLLVQYMRVYSQ